MAVKYRILKAADGLFYPQCKTGWLRSWKFLAHDADWPGGSMRVVMMTTRDPQLAARFTTEQEASEFVGRVVSRVIAFWRDQEESARRSMEGVKARRVIPME